MSSSPCGYLFRLQTRLPRSGDSVGLRVPFLVQQNHVAQFNHFIRPVEMNDRDILIFSSTVPNRLVDPASAGKWDEFVRSGRPNSA